MQYLWEFVDLNENRHLDGKPLTFDLWLEMKNKMRTILIILSTILIVFYN